MGSDCYLGSALTQAGNMTPSEALIGQWIKTPLNEISPNPSPGIFRKCCVSNCVNGRKIVLWKEDHEDSFLLMSVDFAYLTQC
jgi:hypothetical protein